ncbi:hypothetical protein [Algoriphagus namhaensis]
MKYFEIAFTEFIADTEMTDPAYRSQLRMGFQSREIVDHSKDSIPTQIFKGNRLIPNICSASADLGMRMVFSGKAKRVFEKFDNEVIRFYPCPCSHRSIRLDDFWISDIIKTSDDLIDFEKSSWLLSKRHRDMLSGESEINHTIQKFRSLDEFLDFRDNRLGLFDRVEYQELYIKTEAKGHVLFLYEAGPTNLIISEVLLSELTKNKLTKGVGFRPIDMSRSEWYKRRKQ